MKEIRRRTRVVGAFPDGQSCLNLRPRVPRSRRTGVVSQMLHEHAPLYLVLLADTSLV